MQHRSDKKGAYPPRRKLVYKLTVYAPVNASMEEVKDFIEDSLCFAGGCRCPGTAEEDYRDEDPMFYSLDKVTARRITKPKLERKK